MVDEGSSGSSFFFLRRGARGLDSHEEMELSVGHTHILLCLVLSDVCIRLIRLWTAGEEIQDESSDRLLHLLAEYWLVEFWTNA
jgi:hypothetical protein